MNVKDLFFYKRFGSGVSEGGGCSAAVLEPLTVTENGTYTPGNGVDGFSPVTVNVESTGGGGYSIEDIAKADRIKGDLVIDFNITRAGAFQGCTGIDKVIFKEGYVGSYNTAVTHIFEKSSVKEVYSEVPYKATDRGNKYITNPQSFRNCASLEKLHLGGLSLGSGIAQECKSLKIFDSYCDGLSVDNAFNNCSALDTIILRNPSLVPINAPTYWAFALNGTPFDNNPAGAGGTVYVPANLIDEYKVATNWSVLYEAGTCNFVAIEGSEYE